MSGSISVQGFNVGTDASFSIADNFGDTFIDSDLGYLMDFDSESEDTTVKITPISTGGQPVYQTLWNGITGRFMLTRFGPSFQQMFLDLMAAYYAAGIVPQFTMLLSVRNRNGGIDSYQYTGLQFSRPRFGNFRATKEVDMQTGFKASSCVGTGALQAFLAGIANAA